MDEKSIKWTEQQRRAIAARGSDVLVTASAGTGKTAVLSGRCVDIVSDKSICPDIWSILVLTFTDMAAEQMRSRIAEQLSAVFSASGDGHLRRQLVLLQAADISTIHSFCKRLITEYFYKLGIDPSFRIIDGDEQKLLKAESLERTIEWAWQQSNLRAALEQLFYRRDLRTTDGFLAKIIGLSDFLDGVVSRQSWYERASRLAGAVNPLATELGQKQKQILADKLQHILAQIQYAIKLYESENTGGDWPQKWQKGFVEPISGYVKLLKSGDWEKFSDQIRNYQRPSRFEYKPRGLKGPIAEIIRSTTENARKSFDKLSELAVLNPDYLDRVGGSAGLQTKVLVELVKEFDRFYSRAKGAINGLDFADLEHYALKLLTEEGSLEEKPTPSETALALRDRYKYIFVDEYQDINPVQQTILDMLSSEGNVFVVGDVKQSIYAWRGAEPGIFIEQLRRASADPSNAPTGLRVDLNANFRSPQGILDFVNRIFSRIMTGSVAKIDYDESAMLKAATEPKSKEQAPNAKRNVVELHILDEPDRSRTSENQRSEFDNENPNPVRNSTAVSNGLNVISSRQRQAVMIAQRIRQMVAEGEKSEFQIYDKQQDEFRDVEYRDIVILMRSLAKKNDFVEALRLAGVPVSCEAVAGYFETTEISDLLSLLKVLDNPQRDIELAGVLRGPFFKVSDTELAKIKAHSNKSEDGRRRTEDGHPTSDIGHPTSDIRHLTSDICFYDCLLAYCADGPDEKLAGKLREILTTVERWRTLGRRGNLADLLWQIYRETGFLSYVSALPNGQGRRANLLKLHDRAIQFEGFASSSAVPSLRRFVEFIEKLQEIGQDWSPAEPEAAAGNAVRVISVHKSKGLEFPVVFLAELDSRFNKRDIQQDLLADAADTLGLQIIDRDSKTRLSSLAHQVIAEQKLTTALAEEMRILYVATTRARDRLILTASEKASNCRRIICDGFFSGCKSISDWQLQACRSPLEWLLYGLCDQKNLHSSFETGLAERTVDDGLFSIKVYGQQELKRLSSYILNLKAGKARRIAPAAKKIPSKRKKGELLSAVKKQLSWQYRFGDAVLLPAKRSVTQLTHRGDEYVKLDYSGALARKPKAVLPAGPADVVDSRLTPDLIRGTATHLVITRLDLARPISEELIRETKEKLLADGAITEDVAGHIDTDSIMGFFESELGQIALDANSTVWREWPFTFALPACEFSDLSHEPRDTIIVQGIIDMLIQTPGGLLVIDFKTDRVTAEQARERAKSYRRQLELYAKAATAILKSNLLGKWLYFLTPGCAVEIKN